MVPYNGGCSLMVERVVVASDFAKLPIAPDLERGQEEFTDFALCENTYKIRKTRVRFSPSALREKIFQQTVFIYKKQQTKSFIKSF